MQGLWHRFISALTPGVRLTFWTWTVLYLLGVALDFFHVANLGGALTMTGPVVLHGQVWRLASYALLPSGLLDLLVNLISVVVFGGMLERIWTRKDFFIYFFIAAIGSGLAKLVLQPSSAVGLLGPAPIAFALMVATGRLFAHEVMVIPPSFQLTMRQIAILLAIFGFVMMALMAGWVNAVIRVAGGGCGLLYLWARTEIGRPRQAQTVASQRINRLEL